MFGALTGSMFSLNVRDEPTVNCAAPALMLEVVPPLAMTSCEPVVVVPMPTPVLVTAIVEAPAPAFALKRSLLLVDSVRRTVSFAAASVLHEAAAVARPSEDFTEEPVAMRRAGL